MNKKLTITKTISYDYVKFNGENHDEVRDFVERHFIYGNGSIEDSFHVRPSDIPNLNEDELLKWWESTGEIVEGTRGFGRTLNTHNRNNMPIWRKDEMIMVECKCGHQGYVQREWMCIGDTILWINGKYDFINIPEDEIEEYVRNICH